MCGTICGATTVIIGAIMVIGSCIVSFMVVPNVIRRMIIDEMVLIDDTIQMKRFEEVPFPLNLTVRLFNVTNPEEVRNGEVPIVTEVGPYIYKLNQQRIINNMEEDLLSYDRLEFLEFDAESSYPLTEDDILTIINLPYHAILQVAEQIVPNFMNSFSLALNAIFGSALNDPIAEVRVKDFLFNGYEICASPGINVPARIACDIIRNVARGTRNIEIDDDEKMIFSILSYKNATLTMNYKALRGLNDPAELGLLTSYNHSSRLHYWSDPDPPSFPGENSICNELKGTDSGIFSPFVGREKPIHAYNSDICRTIELRYQYETEHEGIPGVRYAANEWFLDNDEGCYCLNTTVGITRDDGCLLRGAVEFYSCVGAYLVLSYPHFLYADHAYLNGVLTMTPDVDKHRIFLDLEPNTGTVLRGAKRAQFNIFMRPVSGIRATSNLRTTLAPILWIEEGVILPEEFVNELKEKLMAPLDLVGIVIPVVIVVSCAILLLGAVCLIWSKCCRSSQSTSKKTTR